jgi:hypothetical protein
MRALAIMGLAAVTILPMGTSSARAQSASAAVVIRGETGQMATLSVADLDLLPQTTVTLSHDGKSTTFQGARLDAVLAKVDAPLGKGMHGPALADVVLVRASDGYRVALSLGDVDPGLRADPVILATREDGKLLGKDGPYRLAVGGELRPARSARNVVEIDVLRLP